jgi:hypothetical protein
MNLIIKYIMEEIKKRGRPCKFNNEIDRKEAIRLYNKNYYRKNNGFNPCECGMFIQRFNITIHKSGKKHYELLKQIKKQQLEDEKKNEYYKELLLRYSIINDNLQKITQMGKDYLQEDRDKFEKDFKTINDEFYLYNNKTNISYKELIKCLSL